MKPRWLIAGLVVVSACGPSGPPRAEVVLGMTDTAVPSRYDQLDRASVSLVSAVETWCTSGDPETAETAVVDVRSQWLALAPFWFGPVTERRSRFLIDPEPRLADVEKLLAGDQPVDAASLRDLAGADQRGLGTIEILVEGEPDERGCEYATGSAELVQQETEEIAHEWIEYGPKLGRDESAANMALRDIVSECLFSLAMAGDDPGSYQSTSRLYGVEWALLGDGDQMGISELLSDDTVERLTTEFAEGDVAEIELTVSTEVVSDLGTAVNFSDADGDG